MANKRYFSLLILFFSYFTAFPAQADSLCDYYRREEPGMYKIACTNGQTTAKPAGADTTFTSSFNINPASLPTEPSSYGIETIASFLRADTTTWGPTFSLIKGFHRFGTGISTGSNNTFYGNDIVERTFLTPDVKTFKPLETQQGNIANLNLGTSIDIYDFNQGPSLQLGGTLRYNQTTGTWGGGPGVLLSWLYFSIGGGFTEEQVSNFLPRMTFITLQASARVSIFEVEYNYLDNSGGPTLEPIHILTGALTLGHLTLTAAVRHLNYLPSGEIYQYAGTAQYLITQNFSLGFLYNYIPGADSVGVQLYL